MTDEEMAENYANEYVPLIAPIDDRIYQVTKEDIIKILKDCSIDSYIDGLKAGKNMNVPTKWHDLRKDPTDVPNENVTVLLLTEVEPVTARYDNNYEAFFRLNDKLDYCIFIAPMSYIAWCEIPKYKEE